MITQSEFSFPALRVHDVIAPSVLAVDIPITSQGGPLFKTCTKCKTEKPTARFASRKGASDGLNSWCRDCDSDRMRSYYRNPEVRSKKSEYNSRRWRTPEIRAKKSEYMRRYINTPEGRAKWAKANLRYRQTSEARIKSAERKRRWAKNPENKSKMAKYERLRRKTNPQARMASILRTRLNSALKGIRKSARTMELLGCPIDHLVRHLESKFQPGMSWGNQGEWHVDHIRPLASFDLSDPHQQREACHWTNLQPLWAADNIRKHAKYETPSTPEGKTGKEVGANRTIAEPHPPGFFSPRGLESSGE